MTKGKHRSWFYYNGIPALGVSFDGPVSEREARRYLREWLGVKRLTASVGPNTEANQKMLASNYGNDQAKLPGWAQGPPMNFPMEIYDTRGHVGTLSFYPTDPQVPALYDNLLPDTAFGLHISVNLTEHGWTPNGLEIAVKLYEEHFPRRAQGLCHLSVLEKTEEIVTVMFPHGPLSWQIYRIKGDALKPGVAEAWQAHLDQLEPEEAPAERDLSIENLKRLTDFYLVRYHTRLNWPNAIHSELKQLIHLWEGIAKVGYEWAKLSKEQKQEVMESIDDE